MLISFPLHLTLKSHSAKGCFFFFLTLCSYCVLFINVFFVQKASCIISFWAFAGCLGALEWTLSETGHLWYGRRYFCMDPVWRKMVCGVGERQRSPGTHKTDKSTYCRLHMILHKATEIQLTTQKNYLSKHSRCILMAVSCIHTQMSWRGTFLSSRWVTSLGHMMALKHSSRTGTALSWLALSVDKDTGPPRLTWRVKSPVASGHPMINR